MNGRPSLSRQGATYTGPPINVRPAPPPVYRPQPALQPKAAPCNTMNRNSASSPCAVQDIRQLRSGLQPGAGNMRQNAPPVYRPQPGPAVLQGKAHSQITPARMSPSVYHAQSLQARTAPPVYRPYGPQPSAGTIQNKRGSTPSMPPPGTPVQRMHVPGKTQTAPVVQLQLHTYKNLKGTVIPTVVVDDAAAPGKMTLSSPENNKVKGNLDYKQEKGLTTLKVINTFPQGYGLGSILMYHLGEQALKNPSAAIDIGAPALTEVDFYLKMGATFTPSQGTSAMKEKLFSDEGAREEAWSTIVPYLAAKDWDSISYFLGGVDKRFHELDPLVQKGLVREKADALKQQQLVDAWLTNKASYLTSSDGLQFRDIKGMMTLCQKSMEGKWKKPWSLFG